MRHGYTLHLLQWAASNKEPPGLWVWASNRIHITPAQPWQPINELNIVKLFTAPATLNRDIEPNLNLKSHQTLHRVRLTRSQNYCFFSLISCYTCNHVMYIYIYTYLKHVPSMHLHAGSKVKQVLFEIAHPACMHLDLVFMLSFPETDCLKKAWTLHLQENTCNMATLHHINGSKRHAVLLTLSRSIIKIYQMWYPLWMEANSCWSILRWTVELFVVLIKACSIQMVSFFLRTLLSKRSGGIYYNK